MDAALNASLHPTQRRLVIALVVTLACLPLLVLDLLGGGSGGSSEVSVDSTVVPEPSMVVAVSPSETEESTTSTTVDPSTTTPSTAPSTTVTTSVPTTVAAKATPKATTTTTAAPKVVVTTTTTAPAPVYVPPPAGPTPNSSESAFLACVRQRESHGDYSVVDPSGTFMGAYQIYQGGWDAVASSMGRSDLVGVRPNHASPADQDAVALQMLRSYGRSPWGGACG